MTRAEIIMGKRGCGFFIATPPPPLFGGASELRYPPSYNFSPISVNNLVPLFFIDHVFKRGGHEG